MQKLGEISNLINESQTSFIASLKQAKDNQINSMQVLIDTYSERLNILTESNNKLNNILNDRYNWLNKFIDSEKEDKGSISYIREWFNSMPTEVTGYELLPQIESVINTPSPLNSPLNIPINISETLNNNISNISRPDGSIKNRY